MTYKKPTFYKGGKIKNKTKKNHRRTMLRRKKHKKTKTIRGGSGIRGLVKAGTEFIKTNGTEFIKTNGANAVATKEPDPVKNLMMIFAEKLKQRSAIEEEKQKRNNDMAMQQANASKNRDKEIKEFMKKIIRDQQRENLSKTHNPPQQSPPSDVTHGIVEYELGRDGDFTNLPGNVDEYLFFKLIDLSVKSKEILKDGGPYALQHARISGKLLEQLRKKIVRPDNNYFKIVHPLPEPNGIGYFVGAKHVIIHPEEAENLSEYLKKHKGLFLAVGYVEKKKDGKKYVYTLPHKAFVSCDGKKLVLMTKDSQIMEFDIKEDPDYRVVGFKRDDTHGEVYDMVDSLIVIKDDERGFEDLRAHYVKRFKTTKSPTSVMGIFKWHLENTLNIKKERKTYLKHLATLVRLEKTCNDLGKATKALTDGPAAEAAIKALTDDPM